MRGRVRPSSHGMCVHVGAERLSTGACSVKHPLIRPIQTRPNKPQDEWARHEADTVVFLMLISRSFHPGAGFSPSSHAHFTAISPSHCYAVDMSSVTGRDTRNIKGDIDNYARTPSFDPDNETDQASAISNNSASHADIVCDEASCGVTIQLYRLLRELKGDEREYHPEC